MTKETETKKTLEARVEALEHVVSKLLMKTMIDDLIGKSSKVAGSRPGDPKPGQELTDLLEMMFGGKM